MSALKQISPQQSRLDVALKARLVVLGTGFLYQIDGAGKCYEATLKRFSAGGLVKLNDGGVWDDPTQVRIKEILSQPEGFVHPEDVVVTTEATSPQALSPKGGEGEETAGGPVLQFPPAPPIPATANFPSAKTPAAKPVPTVPPTIKPKR